MSAHASFEISWSTKLETIAPKSLINTIEKLSQAKIYTIEDLLWIFPLSVNIAPSLQSFALAAEGKLFKGQGTVISTQVKPNFYAKGKKGTLLYNITLHVRDNCSAQVLALRLFNTYPSAKKKLEGLKEIQFTGQVSSFQGQLQIANPEITNLSFSDIATEMAQSTEMLIKYPTVNGVSGAQIQKIFAFLPKDWWQKLDQNCPYESYGLPEEVTLGDAFSIMHGQKNWSDQNQELAKKRIIYHEFFQEQLKIVIRRMIGQTPKAPILSVTEELKQRTKKVFPFDLTDDQSASLDAIAQDLASGKPMMRLIQGDVGCGKTAVAIIAALMVIKNGGQVAMMCPTETLALQHFIEVETIMKEQGITSALLLGSTPRKDKMQLQTQLISGKIDFIVGTHSLIQETVQFKNLTLAIIDEQHKFGVRQRIRLTEKGEATHSLIMTATPIPRSLSLTQFGDLDITTIKTMPAGRKGQKTRIVTPQTFEQFLSFFQTRLDMGEQAYVVVPAIEESEKQEMLALEAVHKRLLNFFPKANIGTMHGRMKAEEKELALFRFRDGIDHVLLATSVIEVGINNPNATIMAIMNPERFGLSSLHQLRGRVGRGDKVGFCFLVNDRQISADSLHRLMIIEKFTDGFVIAEEDLKIRGEGDLFGTGQSGESNSRRLANVIEHSDILMKARGDVQSLLNQKNVSLQKLLDKMTNDPLILSTI